MIILVSLAVCIVGLIIFFATKNNPELKECGKLMFFAGLLAGLLQIGGVSLSFLPKG